MPHWDPIRDLMLLQDRMNQLFEDATQRRAKQSEPRDDLDRVDWVPVADVYEHADEYVVAMDLPGIEREALAINLEDQHIVIRGTRVTGNGDHKHKRIERPQGKFNRSFGLPPAVDHRQIEAEYKDGVLYLRLPKLKEQESQPIKIKVS
ncbi:MAG TPA: Hsp20/alpha crystallin family protein [Pyrinomonadaceae bacterium]|nr:Hsp20/alpha crystallin family protein [Pyrinomonadaceae bacterium]